MIDIKKALGYRPPSGWAEVEARAMLSAQERRRTFLMGDWEGAVAPEPNTRMVEVRCPVCSRPHRIVMPGDANDSDEWVLYTFRRQYRDQRMALTCGHDISIELLNVQYLSVIG